MHMRMQCATLPRACAQTQTFPVSPRAWQLPCYDCYDFEATIAHEVGHVLGFHHPDQEWELNLNADAVMGPSTCHDALNKVHLNKTKDVQDSIMFSMTKARDRTCLSVDDLEGLNTLYPTCEGAMAPSAETGEPLCIKGKRFGGWLRLIFAVLGPWLIVSVLAILTQYCVRMHQKRRLKSLEAVNAKLRAGRKSLVAAARTKKQQGGTTVSQVEINSNVA